jgi:hypothetical protein
MGLHIEERRTMARDPRRKGMPGRDGAGDGLEGADLLHQWVNRHRVHWKTAAATLMRRGLKANEIILLASPEDDAGREPPGVFMCYPWEERELLFRDFPPLRRVVIERPPEDLACMVATRAGGRMRGTFVAHFNGAGMPKTLPTVSVITVGKRFQHEHDVTIVVP